MLRADPLFWLATRTASAVITQAGNDAKVAALVYVSAFAPGNPMPLENRLGRLDDHIRTLLKENKVDELRVALQKAAGHDGLVIHYIGPHGDWLTLEGQHKNGTEYFTGNILTATEMTSVNMAAGLYAPLRIMVYEDANGGSTIEYDKPATQLSQFHSAKIDVQGRSLDDRLAKLCASVLQ
jgi:uncharacterized protein (DUF302 family)